MNETERKIKIQKIKDSIMDLSIWEIEDLEKWLIEKNKIWGKNAYEN